MDPISIVAGVAGIIFTCRKITKALHSIRPDYLEASATIAAICSESTLVSASLSQIQNLILQRTGSLTEHLEGRSDLAATLDTALTGCTVVFACLEEEVARLRADAYMGESQMSFGQRAKTFWKANSMQELLQSIRGQQGAITLLIQILQMESLVDIQRTVKDNTALLHGVVLRTRSLRSANPSVYSRVPGSILRRRDSLSTDLEIDKSTIGETEFEFDDELVNAKVYRRALGSLQHKNSTLRSRRLSTSPVPDEATCPAQIQIGCEPGKCEDMVRADSLFSFEDDADNFWSTTPDLKLDDKFCRLQKPDAAVSDGDSGFAEVAVAPEEKSSTPIAHLKSQTELEPSETMLAKAPDSANDLLRKDALYKFDDVYVMPSEPGVADNSFNLHLIAEHNRLFEPSSGPQLATRDIQHDLLFEDLALTSQHTAAPLIHFVTTKSVTPLPSALKRKASGPQRFIKAMSYKKKKTVSFQLPDEERGAVEERLQRERNLLEERRMSWERRRRRKSMSLEVSEMGEAEKRAC